MRYWILFLKNTFLYYIMLLFYIYYISVLYYIILDDLLVHVLTCIGHLQVILNRNEDFGFSLYLHNKCNARACVYEQLSCKYNKKQNPHYGLE